MSVKPAALSRRRKLAFVAVAFVLTAAVGVSALLAFDVYLHHRVQYAAGVNVWGYRGDVVGRKKPGETRIIVLGGSTAFGTGCRGTSRGRTTSSRRSHRRTRCPGR